MVFEYMQFKKIVMVYFHFNRICKIFNGNPLYLIDDITTLAHIYDIEF